MEENRPIPLFDSMIESEDVGQKWITWVQEYEKYADSAEISEKGSQLMTSALLFYAGLKVTRIYDTISIPGDDYDAVKEKLFSYFNPQSRKSSTETINKESNAIDLKQENELEIKKDSLVKNKIDTNESDINTIHTAQTIPRKLTYFKNIKEISRNTKDK